MDLRTPAGLIQFARQRLKHAQYDPKKLVLIHTGVSALAFLTVLVLQQLLQLRIDETGGLSGMGLRSVLSTASSVLDVALNLLMPFWSFGYLVVTLRLARGEIAQPKTLLEGFRMFAPVLRLALLQSLLFGLIAMVLAYPSILIYVATPLSNAMMEAISGFTDSAGMVDPNAMLQMTEEQIIALGMSMLPALVIYGILFLLVAVPVFYRLRLSQYCLMDAPQAGARRAMRRSSQLMKHNCLALFRLDLRFWWFYLLDLALVALCYGDVLLPMLGIPLPVSSTVSFYIAYVLYLLGQIVLYWWAKNQVSVTYALAYDSLKPPEPEGVVLGSIFDMQ